MRRLLFIISLLSSIFGFTYAISIENEFFYVYRTDETFDTFMRSEVDSIVMSHYDQDSLYHEKCQMQVIHTKDKIYRIPLSEIVDVAFIARHGYAVEEIKKTENSVSQFFLSSNNLDEMEEYLQIVETMDHVDKAWTEDNSFCVKIKNGGVTSWIFTPDSAYDENLVSEQMGASEVPSDLMFLLNPMTTSGADAQEREYLDEKKMCVINQVYNNDNYAVPTLRMTSLKDEYVKAGINVDSIYGEKFDLDFIINRLPEYNLILMMTHGSRDYILTGHNFWKSEEENVYDEQIMSLWTAGKLRRSFVKETRNGVEHNCCYINIHYSFIRDVIKKKFDNSVLFNTSCSSLATNRIYDAFRSKGVRAYLGYDKTNRMGGVAGPEFFNNMLWGKSVKEAYESLDDLRHDYTYNAELRLKGDGDNLGFHLCPDEKHPHMIDLGMPSGVQWSCCNVENEVNPDIKMPERYGGYYAWGELHEKTEYSRNNYAYYSNGEYSDIGVETPASNGISASFQISGTKYDVASSKWGGRWMMPTVFDCRELFANAKLRFCIAYGVNGIFITGKNGRKIFLPYGGYYQNKSLEVKGYAGHYYLGSICKSSPNSPYGMTYWDAMGMYDSSHPRFWGLNIRPVFK